MHLKNYEQENIFFDIEIKEALNNSIAESSGEKLTAQQIAFEKANNKRIEKQFELVKQLVSGNYEKIYVTINEIFETTTDTDLPRYFNSIVTYSLLDMAQRSTKHLASANKEYNSYDILSMIEINEFLTCTDINKVKVRFLRLMKKIEIMDKDFRSKSKMKDIFYYINSNFQSPNLTLNSISEKFQVNNTYISNMFKKEFGNNVLEIIHFKRITLAKELLENTKLSITEIAGEVGYYSHRTFLNIFKKIEKITPSEFRIVKCNFKHNITG